MKRFTSKIITFALAAAFAVTSVPMTAQAAPYVPTSGIVYMAGTDVTTYTSLSISNLGKSDRFKSIKSSSKSVAEIYYSEYTNSKYSTHTIYTDKNLKDYKYNSDSYYGNIGLKLKKAGKAKISFKIGSKSYSTQVTVKKYTNPAKSITVSGVNSGKNFASKTKNSKNASIKVSKKSSNAKIAVKANKGWKISRISKQSYSAGCSCQYSYGKGVSSASIYLGSLAKGENGYIEVAFVDSVGAPITLHYNLTK